MTKEEKDKLIALSDLNRKDNIKYISSEAQGIAITLDSDRYAPTFCKLERAYICGRRKSEEQIAELTEQNTSLLTSVENLNKSVQELEKENAELKAENQKWKDEWQEQVQKATDEGYARTLQTMQLTEAKEIIRELLSSCFGYNSKTVNYEVKARAEQFVKNNA